MSALLRDIEGRQAALDLAEINLYSAVWAARGAGHTWQEVADVLGVTRQAAQQRFHPERKDLPHDL